MKSARTNTKKGGMFMLLSRFLFETKLGEMLLALLESRFGLAVVQAEALAGQRSGRPATVPEPH